MPFSNGHRETQCSPWIFFELFEIVMVMYQFIVLEVKRRKRICVKMFRVKPHEPWVLQFMIAVLSMRAALLPAFFVALPLPPSLMN